MLHLNLGSPQATCLLSICPQHKLTQEGALLKVRAVYVLVVLNASETKAAWCFVQAGHQGYWQRLACLYR